MKAFPFNFAFNSSRRFQRGASRKPLRLILSCVAGLCLATLPAGADQNWDGDDASGNFSDGNNWYGNYVGGLGNFGFGNGSLHFSYHNNASQTSLYYDFAGWASTNDIFWDTTFNTGLVWNGNGNGLDFNQRLENDSYYTQTVNVPLSGAKNGAGHIELSPVNGDLILNGAIYNDNNVSYQVYGANSKMLTINTGLTGNTSVSLTIEAYSKVKITAAQTWGNSSNGVNINTGELWMDAGGSLTSAAPVNVGLSDGNIAKLWLSVLTGGQTFNNNITLNNQAVSPSEKTIGSLNTSGTSTFGGTVTLNGQVNLSAATGGTVKFGGIISGASQNVVINGYQLPLSGVVIFNAANTYSGSTYISGGTLEIDSAGSAANSANFYLGETTGSQTATLALGATSGGQTLSNAITVRAGSSGVKTISNLATSNADTLSGAITLSDNLTFSTASGGTLNLTGTVSGSGFGLTKTGSGTLKLSANNTYTGATAVSAGKLVVSGAISGSSSATIASGATLASGINTTSSMGPVTLSSDNTGGGTLAPGDSGGYGKLTVNGNLNLGTASTSHQAHISLELGGTNAGINYDQVAVSGGAVSLTNADLILTLNTSVTNATLNTNGTFATLGTTFFLVIGSNTSLGSTHFTNDAAAANFSGGYRTITLGNQLFAINYASNGVTFDTTNSGNAIALMAIPEPGTWVMVLSGFGFLLVFQRIRNHRTESK